jgi:uncharacterized protein (DUF2062 family)
MTWLRAKVGQLFRIKDTPHALAVGVAVGVFFGFVPLVGLKTLLALGLTRLLRGSLLAAAIAVTLHDVLLPVAPLLLRWEYDLGYWLMSHPHELPPRLHLNHHGPAVWLHWSTFFTVGRPLLAGSLVFAAPLAVASYYLTLWWVVRSRRNASLSGDAAKSGPH